MKYSKYSEFGSYFSIFFMNFIGSTEFVYKSKSITIANNKHICVTKIVKLKYLDMIKIINVTSMYVFYYFSIIDLFIHLLFYQFFFNFLKNCYKQLYFF